MTVATVAAIAVDGPAASGKSTIARTVAGRLGFHFVDTGSLYRAAALALIEAGVTGPEDLRIPDLLSRREIRLHPSEGGSRVFLGEEEITGRLRSEEAGRLASRISALPPVRERLFGIQRSLALAGRVVMDGRDIGTVILPEARLKIFLVADPEVRARRRMKDLREKDDRTPFETILADILDRDERDRSRTLSPLVRAPDAFLLDTTNLTVEESVRWIIERYR